MVMRTSQMFRYQLGTRADRTIDRCRRTGETNRGDKIWTPAEKALLRKLRDHPVKDIMHHFPDRTFLAVRYYRCRLGLAGKKPPAWTAAEDRVLRRHNGTRSWAELMAMLPGRTICAACTRAKRLGLPYVLRRAVPVATGDHVFDEIRMRAWEDGFTGVTLDRELGTGDFFTQPRPRRPHVRADYLARALDFFDAKLRSDGTIDWMDE